MSIHCSNCLIKNNSSRNKIRRQKQTVNWRLGITGLTRANKIDMYMPILLAETDAKIVYHLKVGEHHMYMLMSIVCKSSGDHVILK